MKMRYNKVVVSLSDKRAKVKLNFEANLKVFGCFWGFEFILHLDS